MKGKVKKFLSLFDWKIEECVKCGYCCTVRECSFGEWDEKMNQCKFLTEENLCLKYDEIKKSLGWEIEPAFEAGCSSTLCNKRREKKLKQQKEETS